MERALYLARLALGGTSPNPAVGAVVVRNGVVVGEGYTQPAGQAHAEIVALAHAGELARGAEMYVTLEPCSHHGRTPPCVKAIAEAGIARVHAALLDPNPSVNGRGLEALRQAGVECLLGEGGETAKELVEGFGKSMTTGAPFVVAKWAMSLDGKIATRAGESKWITGEASRTYAHYLRAICDAVLVGVGTVLNDDPLLTVRIPPEADAASTPALVWPASPKSPLRVILDSRGRIPLVSRVLDVLPAPTMVVTTADMPAAVRGALERMGVQVAEAPATEAGVDIGAALALLGGQGIGSVLIEGGAGVLGSAFDQGLVDKVCAFVAPMVIGGREALSAVGALGVRNIGLARSLSSVRVARLGEDVLITGYMGGIA